MSYDVVAIEREYASGGQEIGEKLAARLGIPCYGKEILERAAEKIGVSTGELESVEETITGSFLYSLYMLSKVTAGEGGGLTTAQRLSIAESEVIRGFARFPCVIIGRCATGCLRDNDRVLRVFIHAEYEKRRERAIGVYNIPAQQSDQVIRRYDKKRAGYFKATAGGDWRDVSNYHMVLDSGRLGMDAAIDVLCSCVTSGK